MKHIYVFSGLGADERAFKDLLLHGYTTSFVKWITPGISESIESYAKRLSNQIVISNSIFIGLSFGGMMAIEVAKMVEPKYIILIASAKCRNEIPLYYRLAGTLKLHRLLPVRILKKPSFITNWFFGVTTREDKKLLAEILRDTDQLFLRWAIDKIVHWRHANSSVIYTHIHGTVDRILPYRFVKGAVAVKDGGHFMSVNKSEELNSMLNKLLAI